MSFLFSNLQALADGKITAGTHGQYPLLSQEARFALKELSWLSNNFELQSKEAEVAKAMHKLAVAERDLERLQVDRLKKALASSCDEERSLAVSEGGPHGTCGLAGELEAKLKAAETAVDRLKVEAERWRNEAEKSWDLLKKTPVVHITCECKADGVIGSTSLNVIRVERQDDGSLTAVTDHWPDRQQKDGDLVGIMARLREMLVQYRERARRVAAHPDFPQVDDAEVSGLIDEADKLIRSKIGRKL